MYQLIRFSLVGIVVTLIDFFIFSLLLMSQHVQYLWSQAIAFTMATLLNYSLSMKYVFKSKSTTQKEKMHELALFFVLSIIGGGLNMILLYLSVDRFNLSVWLSKVMVTIMVMLFNFISRKLLIDQS